MIRPAHGTSTLRAVATGAEADAEYGLYARRQRHTDQAACLQTLGAALTARGFVTQVRSVYAARLVLPGTDVAVIAAPDPATGTSWFHLLTGEPVASCDQVTVAAEALTTLLYEETTA